MSLNERPVEHHQVNKHMPNGSPKTKGAKGTKRIFKK